MNKPKTNMKTACLCRIAQTTMAWMPKRFVYQQPGETPKPATPEKQQLEEEKTQFNKEITHYKSEMLARMAGDPKEQEVKDTIAGLETKFKDNPKELRDNMGFILVLTHTYKMNPISLIVDGKPAVLPQMQPEIFSNVLKQIVATGWHNLSPIYEDWYSRSWLHNDFPKTLNIMKEASDEGVLTTQDKDRFVNAFYILPGGSTEDPNQLRADLRKKIDDHKKSL